MDIKRQLMELIDNLPPHEGKTFEEALTEHLIAHGVAVPVRCKDCKDWRRIGNGSWGICNCTRSTDQNAFCSDGERRED